MLTDSIPPVAIIGTGIAGLAAARLLRQAGIPFAVFEASTQIAGHAATFRDQGGFTYDFGAHFITNRLAKEIGVVSECQNVAYYGESVLLRGRSYSYPFGLMRVPRFSVGKVRETLLTDKGLHGKFSAADVCKKKYGTVFAREVAIPLIEAWSGEPAELLAGSVLEKIPESNLKVVFLRLMGRWLGRAFAIGYGKERPSGLKVWHVYPKDGLVTLCTHLAAGLQGSIYMNSPVEEIIVEAGSAVAVRVHKTCHQIAAVISTMPVNRLSKIVCGTRALDRLAKFRYRAMIFANLLFKGRGLLPDTVLWIPDKAFPFFRLTETPISMPWLAPEGKTILTCDLGCVVGNMVWTKSEDEIADLCLQGLERLFPAIRKSYLGCRVLRTPYAYPVFLADYEEERRAFQHDSGIAGLYSIGRNGEFDHLLTEDVYWRTLRKLPEVIHYVRSRPLSQRAAAGR